jgi:hypothetical protein
VVHSAAATAAAHLAVVAPAHDTLDDTPSLSTPLPRRLTAIYRLSMRCGCIRDATLRKEASARRGSYWAALEANYSPIGGR